MYRQFTLKNSIGETMNLAGSDRLLTSPSGLGYSQTNNLASIGAGFYVNAKKSFPKRNIVGTLVFAGDNPYRQYQDFIDFINRGYDLTLVYTPDTETFYTDIDVEYVQKGEYNSIGVLEVPVSMVAKTPWYKITPQIVNISPGDGGNISIFDLTFDFQFISENTDGSAQMSALGHIPAALEVVIPGPLTNPAITLYNSDAEVIGLMELSETIPAGSVLRYSSKYLDTGVWIDDTEMIEELDLNNENFFRVPLSELCTLRISSEGVSTLSATVNIYNYYRSV